jgi:hypothetical protein
LATQASNSLDNVAFRTKLCQAGLLDVLLDFLNVCNKENRLRTFYSHRHPRQGRKPDEIVTVVVGAPVVVKVVKQLVFWSLPTFGPIAS